METLTHAVPAAQALVNYGHKDITAFLSPYLLSASYTDKLQNESDELELRVEDAAGRWRSSWYPDKGDDVSLKLGYAGSALMESGSFKVDEIELEGPPSVVTIRGLAAGLDSGARTRRSEAYEKQSLRDVAGKTAARLGLTVTGTVPVLTFDRLTQNEETDLAFLRRVAATFGYVFSIRGSQLVFHDRTLLDTAKPVLKLTPSDLTRYRFKDRSEGVYTAVEVAYYTPKGHKLVTHTEHVAGSAAGLAGGAPKGETLKLVARCENKAQAVAMAKAALRSSHAVRTKGSLWLQGEPRLVAGVNVELSGFGKLSGLYQATTSKHEVSRGNGYTVELEVSGVPAA